MRFALDSNIAVAALNGVAGVLARLDALGPEDVLIPSPVLAELLYGALSSKRRQENIAKIDRLVGSFVVLPFGPEAAHRFGELKADLRRRGITKQDFDLAIASIALETGATLATNDRNLLDGTIRTLMAEDWLASWYARCGYLFPPTTLWPQGRQREVRA